MPQKDTKRNSLFVFNEFTVLFAFVAVGLTMLIFGGIFGVSSLDWDDSAKELADSEVISPPAPTTEAYQEEARKVMTPFLQLAANMRMENFAASDPSSPTMLDLVTKTQELMLRVRVPKDSRDPHLAFVLLLDQWKRALGGSKIDQAAVLKKTPALVSENPWVLQQ